MRLHFVNTIARIRPRLTRSRGVHDGGSQFQFLGIEATKVSNQAVELRPYFFEEFFGTPPKISTCRARLDFKASKTPVVVQGCPPKTRHDVQIASDVRGV